MVIATLILISGAAGLTALALWLATRAVGRVRRVDEH